MSLVQDEAYVLSSYSAGPVRLTNISVAFALAPSTVHSFVGTKVRW